MIEKFFSHPDTLDQIQRCWLNEQLEEYVQSLDEQGYGVGAIYRRVPVVRRFADFSKEQGAQSHDDLPAFVEPFVSDWIAGRDSGTSAQRTRKHRNEIRGPVEQFLSLILPDFIRRGHPPHGLGNPFATDAPEFFSYLHNERGLKETTINHYRHDLRRLENYIRDVQIVRLCDLSPAVLSAFVIESVGGLSPNSITGFCCSIRVFLRYVHREGLVEKDLSAAVESPRKHRLKEVPRSISWEEAGRMLDAVDRRYALGKRDYAILLLLLTYGLRGGEVAALTLNDIDWERERILISERKAGHCTAYPLSTVVGEALLTYLSEVRPKSPERRVFLRTFAPRTPLSRVTIANRATHYLRKAGVQVRRPGSHTLRHTCVQRLVDAEFPLKTIGDYVGHSSASSTAIYSKIDVENLREVALSEGEKLL